jgi:hypothetical protein
MTDQIIAQLKSTIAQLKAENADLRVDLETERSQRAAD